MSDKAKNPSAFPVNAANLGQGRAYPPEPGMTLRDYFAGQAIEAAWAAAMEFSRSPETPESFAAKQAYAIADAMLQERAKG